MEDKKGCLIFIALMIAFGSVVSFFEDCEGNNEEKWSIYDGIIVSLHDNTAHANSECKGVKYDSYKRLKRGDIVNGEFDSICSECFTEYEIEQLSEHAKTNTTENRWYQIVVDEIRKEFPEYNLDPFGFQMQQGRSYQDFILYCMRDYLKANSMTEEALMDSLGVKRFEYYDDDDTILHIRYCYYKYVEPPYERYGLIKFEFNMQTDKEFRRKVYDKLVEDGCNIGDYEFFEAAVMADLYCDSNYNGDY